VIDWEPDAQLWRCAHALTPAVTILIATHLDTTPAHIRQPNPLHYKTRHGRALIQEKATWTSELQARDVPCVAARLRALRPTARRTLQADSNAADRSSPSLRVPGRGGCCSVSPPMPPKPRAKASSRPGPDFGHGRAADDAETPEVERAFDRRGAG
jgi:hypothetical protein